mgnify:FL=1
MCLVSIIIPTFNRPDLLYEAVKSCVSQTYSNLEIIVVNDGGEDVGKVINSFLDSRIKYIIHEKNKGLSAARNTGIKKAKGQYFIYLDDDDILYPEHISVLLNYIKRNDHKVVYSDAYCAKQVYNGDKYFIKKRYKFYSFDFDKKRLLKENYIPVLCLMHHRDCLNKTGFFDENLVRLEDWDLWINMSQYFDFYHIKKITCEYRVRRSGSSMMTGRKEPFVWSGLNIFFKYKRLYEQDEKLYKFYKKTVSNSIDFLINNIYEEVRDNLDYNEIPSRYDYIEKAIERLLLLKDHYKENFNQLRYLIALLKHKKRQLYLKKWSKIDPIYELI